MKYRSLIHQILWSLLFIGICILPSCVHEDDLPSCGLYVAFKYDYNMLSADAFHSQVDKVELYVFDQEGVFLFKQGEEGAALATGNYRMKLDIPFGQYRLMAWAGARSSYDLKELTPGVSSITDLTLQLRRDPSLIINKEVEPLWYGEILDVNYAGTNEQTVTINLIKDTNKVRFIFQGATSEWTIDMNDYTYEIIESNGFMDYDNSLLEDDTLSYQPYFMEQRNASTVAVELNTMRLMANRKTRFVVTRKSTRKRVFDINLVDFLAMTEMEGHRWGLQEYFDRQDEYVIVLLLRNEETDPNKPDPPEPPEPPEPPNPPNPPEPPEPPGPEPPDPPGPNPPDPPGPENEWVALRININGWTWYAQQEGEEL